MTNKSLTVTEDTVVKTIVEAYNSTEMTTAEKTAASLAILKEFAESKHRTYMAANPQLTLHEWLNQSTVNDWEHTGLYTPVLATVTIGKTAMVRVKEEISTTKLAKALAKKALESLNPDDYTKGGWQSIYRYPKLWLDEVMPTLINDLLDVSL